MSTIKVFYSNAASTSAARLDGLRSQLPRWRQEAVDRLKPEHDKRLSTIAGLLLTGALAGFGINAHTATVLKNEHGKPYLCDFPNVHFSISHSGDYAVCAISDTAVGCDIQRIFDASPQVARRFFTQREQLHLQNSDDPQKEFVRLWTLKESYVKMKGLGISACPLTSFDVVGDTIPKDTVFYEHPFPGHHAAVCCAVPCEIIWEQYKI